MDIEAIEDVSNEESYIQDLEIEVNSLRSQLKSALKALKNKPPQQDKSCCEAYEVIKKNFHKLLNEVIPF